MDVSFKGITKSIIFKKSKKKNQIIHFLMIKNLNSQFSKEVISAVRMTLQIKAPAAKSEDLSSISRAYKIKEKSQVVL